MFWIICVALALVVILAVMAPFLRQRSAAAEPTAAYDLRVYRDQLREVDRDLDRGVIDPTDAERLKIEIGRKVLEADRILKASSATGSGPGLALPLGILVAIVAGGFWLYRDIGAPNMPDEPYAARIAAAQANSAARPSQDEAEAKAPKIDAPTPDPDYLALIEKLRTAVKERPDDETGLALLSEHEARLGNLIDARKAQQHLVELKGDRTTTEEHARLAALMSEAAGGLITPEAEEQIVAALTLDPSNPQARYMAGMLQWQIGRPDRTFGLWASLLADGPEDAPWIAPIRAAIPTLAELAGRPDYVAPEPAPALPGPDAGAMAAAKDMTPEDRQKMIEGMVEQLETRLATQGGTPEEWARLISSLVVLGRQDHAHAILGEAQTRFAATPEGLAIVNQAAEDAGLVTPGLVK